MSGWELPKIMCGIFGAVNLQGFFGGDKLGFFSRLNDLTSYRGPDDSGVRALTLKTADAVSSDKFDVFLGNRRLSILDLSPLGHQPMTDHQGRWIAYNGEIFNYLELRSELEARGHRFTTRYRYGGHSSRLWRVWRARVRPIERHVGLCHRRSSKPSCCAEPRSLFD